MWLTWQSQNPTGNALYTTPSPKGCAELSCRLDVAYMPQSAPINRSQPVPCALTSVALPGWCMHKILNIFEPQIHCNESVEVQAGITKNHTTRTGFRCAAKNWNFTRPPCDPGCAPFVQQNFSIISCLCLIPSTCTKKPTCLYFECAHLRHSLAK